jgi:DNA-binding CsgD family transcriptional regulator
MTLLERDSHLQTLSDVLASAASGSGGVVFVGGEAGIGKTTLVDRFARDHGQQARALWGACDALFTPRPLGPLRDMAAQLQGTLLAQLNADLNRASLFSTFLAELGRLTTLAVIEDAHWADEATLDLIKYLGRRIQRTQVLLIVTYRDDELGTQHPLRTVLGDLATSATTRRLSLSPLSVDSVRALVGDRTLDAAALCQQTGGNPFFVTEIIASDSGGLPPTVRDVVLARAARLSSSARAVLEAASVIGLRVESWLLAAVTGAEASAVDQCLAAGMLLTHGDGFAFRHELARQAVLDAISPMHRTALHRMTLDALRTSPFTRDDLARLAHHAEAAGDRQAIIEIAPAAARQAVAARSHRAAARLLELALRYADDLPPARRAQLLDELSVECDITDRRPDAIETRRQAAALWLEAGNLLRHGESLSRLANMLQITGQKAEAEQTNRTALEILEPLAPNRELVSAYNMEAWLSLANADNARGVAMAEKAIALATHFEAEDDLPRLYEIAGLCWLYLDHARGTEYLQLSLALALRFDHATRAGNIYANLGSIYVDFHQFAQAEEIFALGVPFARERDLDSVRAFMEGWLAVHRLHRGEWAAAAQIAAEAAGRSSASPGRGPALIAVGRLRTRRGEPDAMTALDESLDLLLKQGFRQREGMIRAARAEAAWQAGDRERTLAEASAAYDLAVSHHQECYVGELAFWRWRAGEPVEVPAWALKPYALHIAGDWRAAAGEWQRMGCPYEQARALADGDHPAQVAALEIFERLGARPAAESLRQKMQAAGAAIPRGPRPATRENPFGLTARQMDILLLLADGLSNPEIAARLHLSRKTVDHHVSAVLARLDVHSREEAAGRIRQHPDFQNPR